MVIGVMCLITITMTVMDTVSAVHLNVRKQVKAF